MAKKIQTSEKILEALVASDFRVSRLSSFVSVYKVEFFYIVILKVFLKIHILTKTGVNGFPEH